MSAGSGFNSSGGGSGPISPGPWTRAGSLVTLTTLTDQVAIGTPTAWNAGHRLEIVASGTDTPLVMVGGSGAYEYWKDQTGGSGLPSKAIAIGLNRPGNAAGDDIVLSTFVSGTWTQVASFANLSGNAIFIGTLTTPSVLGSSSASGTLTLQSTSNATKGKLLFGTSAYDEVNNRLGIGIDTPLASFHVQSTTEQSRLGYDASNYFKTTVGSGGMVGFDAVGASAIFQFNNKVVINSVSVAQLLITDANYYLAITPTGSSTLAEIGTNNAGFQFNSVNGYFRMNSGTAAPVLIYTNGSATSLQLSGATSGANAVTIKPDGTINMVSSQVGNAGLSAGDTYFDTAANIAINGDLILARKT